MSDRPEKPNMRGWTAVAAVLLTAVMFSSARAADRPDAEEQRPDAPVTLRPAGTRRPSTIAAPEDSSLWRTGGALVLVVAGIGLALGLVRRFVPGLAAAKSDRVIEVLSQCPLGGKGTVYVVRCGPRVLIVGATASQLTTLAEIADPDEISGFLSGHESTASSAEHAGADNDLDSTAVGLKDEVHGVLEKIRGWKSATLLLVSLLLASAAPAVGAEATAADSTAQSFSIPMLGDWMTPEHLSGTVRTVLIVSALSLAPALALMTTCFVRIMIVLSFLRQAIGTQGVPSNQVLAALALFMTAAIMGPVWMDIHQQAIVPYQHEELTSEQALDRAGIPLQRFMARQIERTGNSDDVWLFLERTGQDTSTVDSYDQVPFRALAPAFLLSELKTAFLIGFQIYLPFLVIDLVVSAVITGMGLATVPPTLVSLPSKLLLFVLVDGWHLVVGMLLDSFA